MELKFNISFTSKPYRTKPAFIGTLRFVRVVGCDIEALAEHISQGYGFCGDFGFDEFPVKGCKTYANFIGSNLVSVDFDDCPVGTLEGLVDMCGIKPLLAYETYSHLMEGKGNRYRLVFAFAERITSPPAFKDAHRWLCENIGNGEVLGIDTSSASAVQVMYGTTSDRKLLKVGNVIEGVRFAGSDDWFQSGGGVGVYAEEIAAFCKRITLREETPFPYLSEKFDGQNTPTDVKYVSDNWLVENGYAVSVEGLLWVGRRNGYCDGQNRRKKLYAITKGVTRLNRNATVTDILHYAWWLNSTIFAERLRADDVAEQAANAFYDARHNACDDIPEGWRRKRGYRIIPGRSYLPVDITTLDSDTLAVLDEIFSTFDIEPIRAGISDPDRYVLCTEAEATTNIGGFWFFERDKKKEHDTGNRNSYRKKLKHIEGLEGFKVIMDGYDGKMSKRKVSKWLKGKGYAVDNNKLVEWLKLV